MQLVFLLQNGVLVPLERKSRPRYRGKVKRKNPRSAERELVISKRDYRDSKTPVRKGPTESPEGTMSFRPEDE